MANTSIKSKIWSFFVRPFFFITLSALGFSIWLFPYDDLKDLVSKIVFEGTGSSLFLSYENLNLSPSKITLEGLEVEQTRGPFNVRAEQLSLQPELASVLFGPFPFGKVSLLGVFDGDLRVEAKKGKKSELGNQGQSLDLIIKDVQIAKLLKSLGVPFQISGSLSLDTKASVFLGKTNEAGDQESADAEGESSLSDSLVFLEPPEAELSGNIKKFNIPAQSLQTGMGPLNLPDMLWRQMDIKARLSRGVLLIDRLALNSEKKDFDAIIKGSLNVNLDSPAQFSLGGYQLQVELKVSADYYRNNQLLFLLFDPYKKETTPGLVEFRFRARASSLREMAEMEAL